MSVNENNETKERRFDPEEHLPMFQTDRFYCLDGGFASSLQKFHHEQVENDPLWSCRALHTNPEAVIKTHEAFIKAGANIISTNTYQAHHELFKKHISDFKNPTLDSHLIMENAVKLADQAVVNVTGAGRRNNHLVAGSVGPYGACQGDGSEYTGSYIKTMSREALKEWHRDRIKRLTFSNPVDIIAIETIPSYVEALAVLDALEEFPGTRCWISFQCKDNVHTAYGEPIDVAFKEIMNHPLALKVKAIGINCVRPSQVSPLLKRLNTVNNAKTWPNNDFFVKIPYVIYPNSGEEWDAVNKIWLGSSEDLIKNIKEWMELGANLIGGCCRVGPELIEQIHEEIVLNAHEVSLKRCHERRDNKLPIETWKYVENALQKPPYEALKERMNAAKEFFREADEAGEASAMMTAQLEAMMAQENRDIFDEIKKVETRDKLKANDDEIVSDTFDADDKM